MPCRGDRAGTVPWPVEPPAAGTGRRDAGGRDVSPAALAQDAGGVREPALSRCQDTAAAIATALGLGVQTVDGLADLDYGAWQGLTRAEAAARWPGLVDRWFIAPHRVRIPGGESLLDLAARASQALAACLDAAPADATIAVVVHDSVNDVLLCETLCLPLAQYWRLRQDPCCINVIEAGTEFRVALLNGADHLAGVPAQAGGAAPVAGEGAG